jgi:glutathione-independent formaldehyde dehydrogenase
MGGWVGGQANYVLVPYADWNLLKFPDKDQAMEKILDLAMLSDIFPTGYHGRRATARTPPMRPRPRC